jgi:NADP-dependent 3-hydroxy acid dehydrogenase YdfG
MIDINIKGVLYGIAAALPVFRKQGFGHFINTASTAGLITKPSQSVIPARSSPCEPSPKVCAKRPATSCA